tara:strand:+ start:438 stop:731 length:294 start_codon:yes stop_codon:yes gene_type:complete
MEHKEIIKENIEKYLEEYGNKYIQDFSQMFSEEKNHIMRTALEIMLNHWELSPYKPGGFITSFLNNDLTATFSNADSINAKAIRFYLMMKHNLSYPE